MVVNDSNKGYSKIIAGILVATGVVVLLGVFILGVSAFKTYSDICAQSGNTEMLSISEKNVEGMLNKIEGNDNLVPEAKRDQPGCGIQDLEVEAGSISKNVLINEAFEFPLCIKSDADLVDMNTYISYVLTICGGYVPQDWTTDTTDGSYVEVWQKPSPFTLPQIMKGIIGIEWINLGPPEGVDCCCYNQWQARFVYVEDICLISTKLPDDIPACMAIEDASTPPLDPCKKVDLEFNILFKGCHFWLFLASDHRFLESLTPEIIIAS